MQEQESLYNFSAITQIFGLTESRDTFYSKAEKGDEIPSPIKTNQQGYRYWNIKHLAIIGEKYSNLTSTKSKEAPIVNFYVSKGGGSHKTTDAFNFATFLGIHGKRVLVVGLDFQMNISRKFNINNSKSAIENSGKVYKSMYDILANGCNIEEAIYQTNFPNVCIIPESSNLVRLEAWLLSETHREYKIKNILDPLRKEFDVIIIDNNPSWSQLSVNALFSCDVNIASIGIDSNTLEALPQFFDTLEDAKINLKENILVLGMTETNAFKAQSKNYIRKTFGDICLDSDIRKSPRIDEANALHLPVILHDPKSPVADDYRKVCTEIWSRAVEVKNQTDFPESNLRSSDKPKVSVEL